MKLGIRMFIATVVCFTASVALAGETQQITPGEVPAGISAVDWGIVQEVYLKASNTDAGDNFGASLESHWYFNKNAVAISGNTLVVGACKEDGSATGVNGNQSDNTATDAGAVYVFIKDVSGWSQQAYLKAFNAEAGDLFGQAVAIDGNTIVVGAPKEDSDAMGVNGNQSNNSSANSGAAYVFTRTGATWSQQAYLKSSDITSAGNKFGLSVAVSGDTIVVGEPKGGSNWYEGASYVFVRSGGAWSPQATLSASSPDIEGAFGYSVAIAGDTLVIGEPWSYMSYEGGEVYVYVRGGTTWIQQARLHHDAAYSLLHSFGCALAISDNTVVVGLSLIHISEPTRLVHSSSMPSSA